MPDIPGGVEENCQCRQLRCNQILRLHNVNGRRMKCEYETLVEIQTQIYDKSLPQCAVFNGRHILNLQLSAQQSHTSDFGSCFLGLKAGYLDMGLFCLYLVPCGIYWYRSFKYTIFMSLYITQYRTLNYIIFDSLQISQYRTLKQAVCSLFTTLSIAAVHIPLLEPEVGHSFCLFPSCPFSLHIHSVILCCVT